MKNNYPTACRTFFCPYLDGEDIYRPDTFQQLIEKLHGDVGNYIPCIPPHIPTAAAEILIEKTRSIAAAILIGRQWVKVVVSLDRNKDQSWDVKKDVVEAWQKLFQTHNEKLPAFAVTAAEVKFI